MIHVANSLGRMLCETGFQLLILLLGALAASRLLRNSSAANRCLVWQAAAATLMLVPLHWAFLPPLSVPVPRAFSSMFAESSLPTPQPAPTLSADTVSSASELPVPLVASERPTVTATPAVVGTPAEESGTLPPVANPVPAPPRMAMAVLWAVVFWAIVAALLILEDVIGYVRLARLKTACAPIANIRIRSQTAQMCRKFGFAVEPVLLQKQHAMPMAWGWRRPTILLPCEAADWPANRLDMVLAHELAHVRRGDWLIQRLAKAVSCFYWFHPITWICLREMKRSAEQACDDVVLSSGVKAADYAEQLLEVIRIMKQSQSASRRKVPISVAMAHPAQIEGRLQSILAPIQNRSGLKRSAAATALGLALCVAPLGALHVFAQSNAPAPASGASNSELQKRKEEAAAVKAKRAAAADSTTAKSRAIMIELKRQSELLASQKHEIAVLHKQLEQMRAQSQTSLGINSQLGKQNQEAVLQFEQQRRALEAQTRALQLQKEAVLDAQNVRVHALESAEIDKRRAEIDALKADVDRMAAMVKAGTLSNSELDQAVANLRRVEADMLQRQAEMAATKDQKTDYLNAELARRQAQMNLQSEILKQKNDLFKAGALSNADLGQARAALDRAIAELKKRQAEIARMSGDKVALSSTELQKLQAELQALIEELVRDKNLSSVGAISKSELDAARAAVDRAKAGVQKERDRADENRRNTDKQ